MGFSGAKNVPTIIKPKHTTNETTLYGNDSDKCCFGQLAFLMTRASVSFVFVSKSKQLIHMYIEKEQCYFLLRES